MPKHVRLELAKDRFKFSAGHFTIFSATERERLHGHNFRVTAHVTLAVSENGMSADYKVLKDKIQSLCDELDEYLLLPAKSPFLGVEELEPADQVMVTHDRDRLVFYRKDIKLLPVENITIEELAYYLTERFCEDRQLIEACQIQAVSFGVGSGDGQEAFYLKADL